MEGYEELGTVNTWEEALAKAVEMLDSGQVQAATMLSPEEFNRGSGWFAYFPDQFAPMVSLGIIPELYKGDTFRMFRKGLKILGYSDPSWVFVIVYLKEGEAIQSD